MLGVCQKILADSDYVFSNLFFSIIKINSVVSIDFQIIHIFVQIRSISMVKLQELRSEMGTKLRFRALCEKKFRFQNCYEFITN